MFMTPYRTYVFWNPRTYDFTECVFCVLKKTEYFLLQQIKKLLQSNLFLQKTTNTFSLEVQVTFAVL